MRVPQTLAQPQFFLRRAPPAALGEGDRGRQPTARFFLENYVTSTWPPAPYYFNGRTGSLLFRPPIVCLVTTHPNEYYLLCY